ncbi:alpha/beta hydrolase [Pseudonocardia kunmingensis]|uniref:S-formylglutathione hydrolase FrmB n=1 Tax=Pseudonocardia kunmingensis TaxID=630975 RepID=A0A543DN94_9PSEU|nr:alpha/beta hydrolase-fold protein [Pseudonocardia kunmingensis]TQM10804.1 S-formylglutathione hydrolase FrmB [Pseudonocardia kunmingensis]
MSALLDAHLLSGLLPGVVTAAGLVGAAFLLVQRRRRWWTRSVPVALVGAAALTALVALLVDRVWQPFPDPVPLPVLLLGGAALAAVGLAVLGMRARRWPGRAGAVLAVVLVFLGCAEAMNLVYREYPTVRTALGLPAVDEIPFTRVPLREQVIGARAGLPLSAVWRPPAGMPDAGVVTEVAIPAPESGFAARPAWLYLPPAYLSRPRAQLPVLVLLSGQPGSPRDWLDGGELARRMDAFAAAHDGLAPVVVMADHLGAPLANPLCTDSRLGNVATYLSVDVPAWIRDTLQVDADPAGWAVGGFSNGGTCALQMAVTAPQVYPTFVDISGEDEPTLGDHAATVQAAFGGDEAAFAAVNPLDVLAQRQFPATAGYLVAGRDDAVYLPQAQRVFAACQAAGMDVGLHVLPGGHTFEVWGPGLEQALPWLATRLGMTP